MAGLQRLILESTSWGRFMADKPCQVPPIEPPKPLDDLSETSAAGQVAAPLTPEERHELRRRLDAYRTSRDPGEPAATVIEKLRLR